MTRESEVTTDHDVIRRWVDAYGGEPAIVTEGGEVGLLCIAFPGSTEQVALERISWDTFFDQFEKENLAFFYQKKPVSGEVSPPCEFVNRSELRETPTSDKVYGEPEIAPKKGVSPFTIGFISFMAVLVLLLAIAIILSML